MIVLGPISPSEYIPEKICEGLNRYADWLETESGGYANLSAHAFNFLNVFGNIFTW